MADTEFSNRHALRPPFVLFEEDDEEAMFFEALSDILTDRFDILWGESYVGYDSAGRRFLVQSLKEERRAVFGLIRRRIDCFRVIHIDDTLSAEEARLRVATSLSGRPWRVARDRHPSLREHEVAAETLAAAPYGRLLELGLLWDGSGA